MFPSSGHDAAPPSLPRVQVEPVPLLRRYYEVLRFPTARDAALRFLRATLTTPCACLRVSGQVRRRLGAGGFWVWHLPAQASISKTWRRQGVPSSWGILMCLRPALRPRRDPHYQAIAVGRHGPTHNVPRGLSTRGNFGAPSHGISTRCLRFAVRFTPPHARLASGCGPRSTRRDWIPAGFLRKVSEMLLTSLPPSPTKLLGANAVPFSSPDLNSCSNCTY